MVLLLSTVVTSRAATLYFDDDNGTGAWEEPLNWGSDAAGESNRLPATADNVWIGTNAAAIGPTNAVANNVYVGSPTLGPAGEGLLSVTDTNASLDANALRIGNGGTNGTFKLEKGSVNINVNNSDTINLGTAAFTHGTFEMGLLGAADADALFIGAGTGNRRIQVGATADSSGTFIINSGAFTNAGNLVIGQGRRSTSRTEIHGGSVTINADINLNNGDMRYEQDGGTVTVNNFNMSNNGTDTSTVSLVGGTLVVRNGFNDRNGAGIFNLGGTGILDISSNNGTRDVEVFSMTGSSVMRLGLHNALTGVTQPLTILTAGAFADTPTIEVTVTNLPGNADLSGKTNTWIGGPGEWDTDGGKWDLGVTPDGVNEINTGDRFTVITSPNALSNATVIASGTAGWDVDSPDTNTVNLVRTGPPLGSNGVAAANIDNAASIVTRNSELRIAREVGANAADLYLSDGSLTLSGTNELVIGGGVQGRVYQEGGVLDINDDLRFGTSTNTEGGVYDLNGGTLRVHGNIVETAPNVNSAQLMLNGGTLDVDGSVLVQRFSVAEAAGTTVSYTVNPTTPIATSGTLAVGGSGNGTLIIDTNSAPVNVANLYVANNGGTGLLIVTNGTLSTTNGHLIVGDNNDGVGTAILSGATVTTTNGGLIAGDQDDAVGTVIVHNASITLDTVMQLGRANNGQGYLRMRSGSISVGTTMRLGAATANSHTAVGTALIEDGTLSVNGGRFDIAGDSENDRHTTGTFVMGTEGGGGNPQVSVKGGNTEVGRGGNGTFTMHSGRFEQKSNHLVLGQGSNAVAVVTLNGGDMVITNDINFNRGTGTFNHNAGNVTARDVRLGATDGDFKDQGAVYDYSGVGMLDPRRIVAGEYTTGTFNHLAGTITVSRASGVVYVGGKAGGATTLRRSSGVYNLGTASNEATLNVSIGNLEVGRSRGSTGVFNHTNGHVNITDVNLVLGQHANATDQSDGTYNLDDPDGALTLEGTKNGNINFNAGHGVFNHNAGTVTLKRGNLNLGSQDTSRSEYNLNAGQLVIKTGVIDFRGKGERDAFNLAGGTLDMTGGIIHYGNRTGLTNVFAFTAGVMKNVATFNGDLEQEGGTLVIGDGIGATAIAAGGSQGMAGDYRLSSAGTLEIQIDGTAGAGVTNGHDQLVVAGSVDLDADASGGGTLALSMGAGITKADVGTQFTIIDVAGTTQGTFASGSVVSVENGSEFLIDYTGGDGNDVVLTLTSFGPPGTMVIVK